MYYINFYVQYMYFRGHFTIFNLRLNQLMHRTVKTQINCIVLHYYPQCVNKFRCDEIKLLGGLYQQEGRRVMAQLQLFVYNITMMQSRDSCLDAI